MIDNPRYFYELFLKTRYLNEFTKGDLRKYAELIMLSTIDFKKVYFDKAIQKRVMGRHLTTTEERIDKVILHSDMFAQMAMAFIEQQLNPCVEVDHSAQWPFLKMDHKSLLLKYLFNLKIGSYNTKVFEKILSNGLDIEMIPDRYLKMSAHNLKKSIKNYDPDFQSETQLSMEE